jgi:hypothetical protein
MHIDHTIAENKLILTPLNLFLDRFPKGKYTMFCKHFLLMFVSDACVTLLPFSQNSILGTSTFMMEKFARDGKVLAGA